MKIKFLEDYIGRESAMKQYYKGESVVFPFYQGLELIRLGHAVLDEEPKRSSKKKVEEVLDGEDA